MEKVFEPVTAKQAEATENQIQALHDSSQTTRQAIENQTRAIKEGIQESCNNLHDNLQNKFTIL